MPQLAHGEGVLVHRTFKIGARATELWGDLPISCRFLFGVVNGVTENFGAMKPH